MTKAFSHHIDVQPGSVIPTKCLAAMLGPMTEKRPLGLASYRQNLGPKRNAQPNISKLYTLWIKNPVSWNSSIYSSAFLGFPFKIPAVLFQLGIQGYA